METAGVSPGGSRSAVALCVMVVLLVKGSSGLVCYTAVESLDLGCLLRWTCPRASPNTTYSVQTKTQGGPWQNVSWCVWVSSRSCDVSQAFSDFRLDNLIRLGVHLGPGSTAWIQPRKFGYSDFRFSRPSVSVSLKDEQLLVEVRFPCAANRRCLPESCCPISEVIDPWTTSRTVWTQEVVSFLEFSGLSPGQNYCAVANFSLPAFSMAASPKSTLQCVHIVSKSASLPVLCLGILLVSLLLAPLLVVVLKNPGRAAATEPPAKTPSSARDPVSLDPRSLVPVPVDPCDIHIEFPDDHISMESSSSFHSAQDHTSAHSPVQQDSSCGAKYWDSGGTELERGLDSGLSVPQVSHSSEETCDKMRLIQTD
ncbi:uncharacterized protein [Paralichthys olivaceus]|uniref:uncharacterized protein isoform X2 n=1 Tax=Paralichthys olivaceus TaxID=8255 RepID=UPI003750EBFE